MTTGHQGRLDQLLTDAHEFADAAVTVLAAGLPASIPGGTFPDRTLRMLEADATVR